MRSIEQTFEREARRTRAESEEVSGMSSTAVRLTRRGRIALVMVAMAVMVVAGMMLGHGSSQAASPGEAAPRAVTVQAGQSLWSVAAAIAPHQDPRLVVSKLEAMNNLPSGQVFAGQRLLIPTFG